MSNKLRNPFRMRASEKIESDDNFLHIYSPSILDSLLEMHQKSKLWGYVTYIHSSPGGGKTSLLRIFEPPLLNALFSSQTHYKDVFSNLKKIDVFTETHIKVLGIYLLCSRSFEMLEDINISPPHKKRLFNSLLNSRVIIAALKSILQIKNKKFPDDLKEIRFNYTDENHYFQNLKIPCDGEQLYRWAENFELKIYSALDSFIPIQESSIPGHNELFSFSAIAPENISINGVSICERFLFMLDDMHKLTYRQRGFIKEGLIEKRGNYSLWIAERIEALEPEYTLAKKNIPERDFQTINIEDFFRGKDSKYSTLLSIVSQKRAQLSSDNLNSFQEHLSPVINEENYKDNFLKSINDSREYFSLIMKHSQVYDFWINHIENKKMSIQERAILMKQVEILIHRNVNKQQLSLFGMEIGELDHQLTSEVKSAARYFICKNYKIPYYYGFSDLVKLSSCNIEQFLSFSSELFERMLSNKLLGNNITLSVEEQEKVIFEVVSNRWKSLITGIPHSTLIVAFLNKLGKMLQNETNKPNAPYAMGVTGFAIKPSQKGLFGTVQWYEQESFKPLADIISTCVAYNIFEVRPTNQGAKGQAWNVYYLNRWLCIHYNLPLTYGGWRPKASQDLIKWIK